MHLELACPIGDLVHMPYQVRPLTVHPSRVVAAAVGGGGGRAAGALLAALLAAARAAPAPGPCAAPLCACAAGALVCDAVPFHRFPDTDGDVRHVSVWGARLGALEEAALDARALHTLVLVACRLDALHAASLASMRSTLASLDLGHNEFTEVPLDALRELMVLNWLNLQNNLISDLDHAAEWGGLAESLTSLSLSNNRLSTVSAGALAPLRALTQLELDGNRLRALAAGALPRGLALLRLSDNLLPAPPAAALSELPRLAHLTLRDNMLGSAPAHSLPLAPSPSHLHTLDLAHNALANDFQLDLGVKMQLKNLILDQNDLTTLPGFVIECGRLEKLSVSHNRLILLSETATSVLARDLRHLELDYNELTALPAALREMTRLRRLSAAYNRLSEVPALPPRLYALSLAGNDLSRFPDGLVGLDPGVLGHLDLGYNRIAHVSAAMFGEWAAALDTLSLRGNRLAALGEGAFPALPLRELALSFNDLFALEPGALGALRSLAVLELAGSLASGAVPLAPPTLTWLALDNNEIHRVTVGDLLVYPQLEYLNLDFNKITAFPSGLVALPTGNLSNVLKELRIAYNYVSFVDGQFLSTLPYLQSVDLSYNRMKNISERTFSNLSNLAFVSLVGNEIEWICASAFHALPRLQALELQHNRLMQLATDIFEYVADDETNFSLNASNNQIVTLMGGRTVPISVLDLSHNALETLSAAFFEGVAAHLRRLLLAHNKLVALDELGASTMPRLAVLSLRNNALESLRRRALAATPALEELDLAENRITTLAPDQFRALRRLRSLRLAGNKLRAVPPGALAGTLLEALDVRDNRLLAPPAAAVARVGFTLRRLELAGNALGRLDAAALASVGFLRELGLARTALRVLPDAALAGLGRLRALDLSYNILVANYRELLHPVPRLRRLALVGTGLRTIPSLPLPALRELDLSANAITACRESDVIGLTELRALNLSQNRLTSLQPALWGTLPRLVALDVSHNLLERLTSGAFEGLPRLLLLRMHGLHALEALEPRALQPLTSLRTLELDVGTGTRVGAALAAVPQLQALTLHVREPTLDKQLLGLDADKLRAVELRGTALRHITARALAPLERARALALRVHGTSVAALPAGLGARLARVPQLALELSDNALVTLAPAALYPNLTGWNRRATKLLSGGLVVQEGALRCGCGASWVGAWLRRWTREVGGGARGAAAAARRSWCAAGGGGGAARRALLGAAADAAECRASALAARAPPRPPRPPSLALCALLLLLPVR